MVKCSIDIYLDTLTHIINLSLSQGVFPSQLKTAKVIPLYKSNDKQLIKIIGLFHYYRYLVRYLNELYITDFIFLFRNISYCI